MSTSLPNEIDCDLAHFGDQIDDVASVIAGRIVKSLEEIKSNGNRSNLITEDASFTTNLCGSGHHKALPTDSLAVSAGITTSNVHDSHADSTFIVIYMNREHTIKPVFTLTSPPCNDDNDDFSEILTIKLEVHKSSTSEETQISHESKSCSFNVEIVSKRYLFAVNNSHINFAILD
jgi:hypothetical protein